MEKRYWDLRHQLWSKFDQGVRMDEEGWFSVTPEAVAAQIAQMCRPTDRVLDAFCGCGGNAVQFGLRCQSVVAIDLDADRLAMAEHNAEVYGVRQKIEFQHGALARSLAVGQQRSGRRLPAGRSSPTAVRRGVPVTAVSTPAARRA